MSDWHQQLSSTPWASRSACGGNEHQDWCVRDIAYGTKHLKLRHGLGEFLWPCHWQSSLADWQWNRGHATQTFGASEGSHPFLPPHHAGSCPCPYPADKQQTTHWHSLPGLITLCWHHYWHCSLTTDTLCWHQYWHSVPWLLTLFDYSLTTDMFCWHHYWHSFPWLLTHFVDITPETLFLDYWHNCWHNYWHSVPWLLKFFSLTTDIIVDITTDTLSLDCWHSFPWLLT